MNLYYSDRYVQSSTAFDTTRKARWVADSYADDPSVTLVAPRPLTVEDLYPVHTPTYINAIRTGFPAGLASSSGFDWDARTFDRVCASNGGVVQAVWDALAYGRNVGSLSSGLHHAYTDQGGGFCTFNGLALAAHAVKDAGVGVLILDLDAHNGGGTHSLVESLPNVVHLDLSLSDFDGYPSPKGLSTLDVVTDVDEYFWTLGARLRRLNGASFGVVIYNAGVDVYPTLSAKDIQVREHLVFEWANARKIPVAFVLAGGYTGWANLSQDQLVNLHRLTVNAAAEHRFDIRRAS